MFATTKALPLNARTSSSVSFAAYVKAKKLLAQVKAVSDPCSDVFLSAVESIRKTSFGNEVALFEKMLTAGRDFLFEEEREGRYYLVYDDVLRDIIEPVLHVEISGCAELPDGSSDMNNQHPDFFTVYVHCETSMSIAIADFDTYDQANSFANKCCMKHRVGLVDRYADVHRAVH